MSATWDRAVLPRDRDHRINGRFDFACAAFRLLDQGETVQECQIVAVNGQGRAALIVKDSQGLRKITITDERVA